MLAEHACRLGLGAQPTPDEIHGAYRKLSLSAHPDKGGSAELFCQLTKARDALLEDTQLQAMVGDDHMSILTRKVQNVGQILAELHRRAVARHRSAEQQSLISKLFATLWDALTCRFASVSVEELQPGSDDPFPVSDAGLAGLFVTAVGQLPQPLPPELSCWSMCPRCLQPSIFGLHQRVLHVEIGVISAKPISCCRVMMLTGPGSGVPSVKPARKRYISWVSFGDLLAEIPVHLERGLFGKATSKVTVKAGQQWQTRLVKAGLDPKTSPPMRSREEFVSATQRYLTDATCLRVARRRISNGIFSCATCRYTGLKDIDAFSNHGGFCRLCYCKYKIVLQT